MRIIQDRNIHAVKNDSFSDAKLPPKAAEKAAESGGAWFLSAPQQLTIAELNFFTRFTDAEAAKAARNTAEHTKQRFTHLFCY